MKVVSIDVGIKNMAYCVLANTPATTAENTSTTKVETWDIINVAEETPKKCIHCIKPTTAKFKKNEMFYCLKHAKAEKQYIIQTSELKHTTINKQKLGQLLILADKYNIKYDKEKTKKPELVSLIHKYVDDTCFEKTAEVNASNVDLITVGRNIQKKFDVIFHSISLEITHVIIENQISPIANRMKTIQGMVAQYFIMKNPTIIIEFISSSNKLKIVSQDTDDEEDDTNNNDSNDINGEKLNYTSRKKKGVVVCLSLLKHDNVMSSYLKTHKKKDDLADAFLQGIWYINKNK
jgi:hypothetical protein